MRSPKDHAFQSILSRPDTLTLEPGDDATNCVLPLSRALGFNWVSASMEVVVDCTSFMQNLAALLQRMHHCPVFFVRPYTSGCRFLLLVPTLQGEPIVRQALRGF